MLIICGIKMKKIIISGACLTLLASCTHQSVEVNKIGDKQLSCSQISSELMDIKLVKKDIDDKTGFSGRNVGMGLLFWPGVIVNELNANDAEKNVNERINKLVKLHEDKGCDSSQISSETIVPKEK